MVVCLVSLAPKDYGSDFRSFLRILSLHFSEVLEKGWYFSDLSWMEGSVSGGHN